MEYSILKFLQILLGAYAIFRGVKGLFFGKFYRRVSDAEVKVLQVLIRKPEKELRNLTGIKARLLGLFYVAIGVVLVIYAI